MALADSVIEQTDVYVLSNEGLENVAENPLQYYRKERGVNLIIKSQEILDSNLDKWYSDQIDKSKIDIKSDVYNLVNRVAQYLPTNLTFHFTDQISIDFAIELNNRKIYIDYYLPLVKGTNYPEGELIISSFINEQQEFKLSGRFNESLDKLDEILEY